MSENTENLDVQNDDLNENKDIQVEDNQDIENKEKENIEQAQDDIKDENKEVQNGEKDNKEVYGAPDNYDFKGVELPEGFAIDENLAKEFAPIGKELNLSQQSANKLAGLLVKYQQSQLANANEKIADYKKQEKEATKLSYEKMLSEDVEIGGGNQDKMNAYIDVADVGYREFATDELKAVLKDLQLDYHPAVIKHFHKLGKLCGVDKLTKTNSPVSENLTPAQILYGER